MLSALLFSCCLLLAAFAADEVSRILRRARRWPWLIACSAAAIAPLAAVGWGFMRPETNAPSLLPMPQIAPMWVVSAGSSPAVGAWLDALDVPLLVFWALASVFMCWRLAIATRYVRRVRNASVARVVDGNQIVVSTAVGPAAIGVVRPVVIVPAWILELDAPLRSLVLRHEHEHCRARDPRLLWASAIATALMPWNAALWVMATRLRLAIEIDCDARTVRDVSEQRLYAKLLILMSQHRPDFSRTSGQPIPMLTESASHLARRITAMHTTPIRFAAARLTALASMAFAAIAVACSPRIGGNLTSPANASAVASASRSANAERNASGSARSADAVPADGAHAAGATARDSVYFEYQVSTPVTMAPGSRGPLYPAALRTARVEGRVLVQFVVDTDGTADMTTFRVMQSADPAFTESVRTAVPLMRFHAAELPGGVKVRQLLQQPFQFALDDDSGDASAAKAGVSGAAPVNRRDTSPLPAEADRSDHADFTASMRTALEQMRFTPATVDGRAVRQLKEMPFAFRLDR